MGGVGGKICCILLCLIVFAILHSVLHPRLVLGWRQEGHPAVKPWPQYSDVSVK